MEAVNCFYHLTAASGRLNAEIIGLKTTGVSCKTKLASLSVIQRLSVGHQPEQANKGEREENKSEQKLGRMLLVIKRREEKRAIKTNSKVSRCSKVLVLEEAPPLSLQVSSWSCEANKRTILWRGSDSLIRLLSVLLIIAENSEESFIMLRVKLFTFAELKWDAWKSYLFNKIWNWSFK